MLKRAFVGLGVAAVVAAGNVHAAKFSSTYFFGDSLTDSGSYIIDDNPLTTGRFTVDPGHVWAEDLAAHYGTFATPYGLFIPDPTTDSGTHLVFRLGGTNYAQGGARVDQKPGVGILNAVPVSEQVDVYLGGNSVADPNALYTVWAGANDIFFQAAAAAQGTVSLDQAVQNVGKAAVADVTQIARLHAAGARYILVPNLPAMGNTPASMLVGIQIVGTFTGATDAKIALAQQAAVVALRTAGIDQAVKAAADVLGQPDESVKGARNLVESGFNQLSQAYDKQLLGALDSVGFETIPLDLNSLFNEVLAEPAIYGFDNVIAPACNTASALQCNSGTVDTSQRYFFADSVHPTPAAHAILAEYAASVIDAPQEISVLPNVVAHAGRSQADTLDRHMRIARDGHGVGGVNAFISGGLNQLTLGADSAVADTDAVNRNFTAGVDWQFSEHALIGAALGYTDSDPSFGNDGGGFEMHDKLAMVYAGFGFGKAYVNAMAGLGLLEFHNVERDIHLGSATRAESGDTDGHQQMLRLGAGYRFDLGSLHTGPVAALTYQRIHVGGYDEDGNDSTSMHFGDQNLYSLMGSVGWQAALDLGDTAVGRLQPYVRATYEQEFKNRDRSVSAGLKTFGGSFSMPAYLADRYYTEVAIGVSDRIGRNTTVSLGFATAVGLEGSQSDSMTLGLNHYF